MGLKTLLVLDHQNNESANDLQRILYSDNRQSSGFKLEDAITQIVSGVRSAKATLGLNAVQATGTVTLSSHVATNTVTINGVVFTCVASGATGNQYNVGGNDTATAVNLAAAINASVSGAIAGLVSASSATNVVTITAITPGLLGNLITLAISANGSVSGANASGGTQGSVTSTNYYGSAV